MSRHFGRYLIRDEVRDELGRGGFGRVYRAFDPNLSHYVAIKVLSSTPDEEMLKRFQDESRTTCKLKHENIVKVLDFDLQDGMPYLVMELLEGETLDKLIAKGELAGRTLELLDKVEIMLQVAKGLQYAHGENVIHRDIKPGNIMVLPNGVAKIMDFGIARVVDKEGTRRTRQGNIAGTIQYMGPEQFKGGDADKLTDIFAYGGLYYELLTGKHPFAAEDPGTVIYKITTVDPPPIRNTVAECPEALDYAIQRMLIREREFRVDKMEDVVRTTQPILIGLRQERAAAIAAGIALLMAQGLVDQAQVSVGQALDLDPLNKVAQQWREKLAEQSHSRLKKVLADVRVREANEHAAARRFDLAVQSLESAAGLDQSNPDLQARLEQSKAIAGKAREAARLLAEARSEIQQGNPDGALERATRALELDPGSVEAARLGEELREQVRSRREAAELARAEALRLRGDYRGALALLDSLAAAGSGGSKVAALRALVERDRAEAERQKRNARFRSALSAARHALTTLRLEEAAKAAEALCREFPDEPDAADFLSEVREHQAAQKRQAEVGHISQTAREMIRRDQIDDAMGLLEGGLRSYPGDTTMHRLMEMVAALAAARDRVHKVNEVVRQARELLDAGRLDDALHLVDAAIGEFGQETTLVECKRNLDFEKEHREQVLALQRRLEEARRLLAADRPKEAVDLLEETAFRYPGEPDVPPLLASARAALAAAVERDFAVKERLRIAPLEAAGQFSGALAIAETALERYPNNPELLIAAARLRQKLDEQEREQAVAVRVRNIEEAIRAERWDEAAADCGEAQKEFPQHPALTPLPDRIREARRRAAFQQLRTRVEASFARWDLADVRRQLESAREESGGDPTWQALWRQLESWQAYEAAMLAAEQACRSGNFEDAERMLRPLLAGAPDGRAAKLKQAIAKERRDAEESLRREAEERIQREAAEKARLEREHAIAAGRQEAAELVRRGDVRGAIAVLNRLVRQYGASDEIRMDLDAAEMLLAQQLREEEAKQAEIEARQQAERAAVAAGRQQAAELAGRGDYTGAISQLDALIRQYPDHGELLADRRAAEKDRDRRRREAEEAARRERERAIAQGRSEAAKLAAAGQYQSAIALLAKLALQYPDRPEIVSDRAATEQAWEKQRRDEEARVRRQQDDQAVARGCEEAASLAGAGDYRKAIANLDALAQQYPTHPAIPRARQEALLAGERREREAQDQARLAKGREEAEAFRRSGDLQAAVKVLDKLLAQFPRNVELRKERDAAAREVDRWKREREERARQALGRRAPPPPAPPSPDPAAEAEARARQALKAFSIKTTSSGMPALRVRYWYTPLLEFLVRVRAVLFGLAAMAIALCHQGAVRLFAGKNGSDTLPDRLAVAWIRWLAERERGDAAIEAARDHVAHELGRRKLRPDRVGPLSRRDTILTGAAGIVLLAVVAAIGYFFSSRVEAKATPTSLEFTHKAGVPAAATIAVSPANLEFSFSWDQPWLRIEKFAQGVKVSVQDRDLSLPEGPHQGEVHIEFKSGATKNRSLDVPVTLTILPPMRVTPETLRFASSGSRQLTVTGAASFTASTDPATRKWLKAAVEDQTKTITVSADGTAVGPGAYSATLTVRDETGAEVHVPIGFRVQ
jgi:serine/threonine-protein kinase